MAQSGELPRRRYAGELATAAESPATTATITLSMIESHPELKRLLSDQLATSLEMISKTLIASHPSGSSAGHR